jgi:hypothetical protein
VRPLAIGRLLRWIAALGCVLLGVWLLPPGRNAAGNPAFEQEIRRCRLPNGDLVRLYEGNGGATTAFWYTVTHDGGWWSPERQILFSYGSPEVKEITCGPAGVELAFWDGVDETREVLSRERIRGKLRRKPIALRMGERVEPGGSPFRWVGTVAGVVLLVLGVLVAPWKRRSRSGTATMDSISSDGPER